jgi:hypothetical protein
MFSVYSVVLGYVETNRTTNAVPPLLILRRNGRVERIPVVVSGFPRSRGRILTAAFPRI